MIWSSASSPCRIEWRPSRLCAAACLLLGMLAALSVALSAMPSLLAWPLGMGAAIRGGWAAWRHVRQPPALLVWAGGDADAQLAGETGITLLEAPRLGRRGPWLWLDCRDEAGKRRRLLWWPDTLNGPQRRALVVASQRRIGGDSLLPLVAG